MIAACRVMVEFSLPPVRLPSVMPSLTLAAKIDRGGVTWPSPRVQFGVARCWHPPPGALPCWHCPAGRREEARWSHAEHLVLERAVSEIPCGLHPGIRAGDRRQGQLRDPVIPDL